MARLYDRKGVWWANLYYYDGQRRKRVQRSTGILAEGKQSERTAERVARDMEAALVAAKGPRKVVRLDEAFRALAARKRRGDRSHATLEILSQKASKALEHFGATRDAATLTQADLEAYATAARQVRAAATVHRECRELIQAVALAGGPKLTIPDVGRVSKPRERWLTPDETSRLLAAAPARRREHLLAYRLLGVRKSELYRIEARDVDLAANEVRVRGTKSERSDRRIPLAPEMRAVLSRRMISFPSGPLFEPWTNADRDLRDAAIKAGLGPVSFNDLRRSFATELARAEVPSLFLASLLGHTSTRMVEHVYAHVKRGKHLHDAVGRLATYGKEDE